MYKPYHKIVVKNGQNIEAIPQSDPLGRTDEEVKQAFGLYLKKLIKPRDDTTCENSWKIHMEKVEHWKSRILFNFEVALKQIHNMDALEKPISREDILTLAVTVNQILRHISDFESEISYEDLKKAQEICDKFKVKGLSKKTDYCWFKPDEPSKLEQAIGKAIHRKGSVHCRICGRLLTNTGSVRRGIGPVCWRKMKG